MFQKKYYSYTILILIKLVDNYFIQLWILTCLGLVVNFEFFPNFLLETNFMILLNRIEKKQKTK